MDENQELLMDYFIALGATRMELMYLMALLYYPPAAQDMINYIADTGEKELAKLMSIASKIYAKYPEEDDL